MTLTCGALTLVPRANPLACERGTRAGDRNLNRSFVPLPPAEWTTPEDGVTAVLAGVISRHDVLLDLHSASSPTDPFAMIGLEVTEDLAGVVPEAPPAGEPFAGAALELALAAALDVAVVVEGWFDVYDAALLPTAGIEDRRLAVGTNELARSLGLAALTVECGEHSDPMSSVVASDVVTPHPARARDGRGCAGADPAAAGAPHPLGRAQEGRRRRVRPPLALVRGGARR